MANPYKIKGGLSAKTPKPTKAGKPKLVAMGKAKPQGRGKEGKAPFK